MDLIIFIAGFLTGFFSGMGLLWVVDKAYELGKRDAIRDINDKNTR